MRFLAGDIIKWRLEVGLATSDYKWDESLTSDISIGCGMLPFFPSAQATVYKCEGDKSVTPICTFKDEDVSFLGRSAVVY